VVRRVEAFPQAASTSEREQLQKFTRNAAYLGCVWDFDPRSGSGWSEHVTKYMRSVAELPSSSLQLPELPSFFSELNGIDRGKLIVTDSCLMWFSAMFCDLGYLARDLGVRRGPSQDVCWKEVAVPPFGFTLFGINLMPDRPLLHSRATDEYDRPEYLACQDKRLTREDVQSWCPMRGHYPAALWNISWGEPAPPGSVQRHDVLTCNKKLGNPDFTRVTDMPLHIADEGEDVDVMKPFRGYLLDIDATHAAREISLSTPLDEALRFNPEMAGLVADIAASALATAEQFPEQRGSLISLAGTDNDEDHDDDGWVWSEETALRQNAGTPCVLEHNKDLCNVFSPLVAEQCPRFVAYFWPQVSFWSEEVVRRVEALPEAASNMERKQLQHFVRNAAYLGCAWFFDPRIGSGWSEHVAEYMRSVAGLPSSSLQLPELPAFFANVRESEPGKMIVPDVCMMWFTSNFCDLGYLARGVGTRTGRSGDVCWDKIPLPPFGFTLFDRNLMPERPTVKSSDADGYDFPEYMACQDRRLTREEVTSWCPMGGHYPDGMWNTSWGEPAPLGSQLRTDVLKCNKKLGIPDFARTTDMLVHIADEGEDVDIMKPFRGYLLDIEKVRANKAVWQSSLNEAFHFGSAVSDLLYGVGTNAPAHTERGAGE